MTPAKDRCNPVQHLPEYLKILIIFVREISGTTPYIAWLRATGLVRWWAQRRIN